jgi:hypothetical protein
MWQSNELPRNGVNLFNCSLRVGLASVSPEQDCCAPWLGGIAPLGARKLKSGIGLVHHLDMQHAIDAAARRPHGEVAAEVDLQVNGNASALSARVPEVQGNHGSANYGAVDAVALDDVAANGGERFNPDQLQSPWWMHTRSNDFTNSTGRLLDLLHAHHKDLKHAFKPQSHGSTSASINSQQSTGGHHTRAEGPHAHPEKCHHLCR